MSIKKQIIDEINFRMLTLYELDDYCDTHGGVDTRARIGELKRMRREIEVIDEFDKMPGVENWQVEVKVDANKLPHVIPTRDVLEFVQKLKDQSFALQQTQTYLGAVQRFIIDYSKKTYGE